MVKHIILWTLNPELSEAEKQQVKQGMKAGLEALVGKVPGLIEAKVNIDYMYAFLGGKKINHAYMIFRVTDTKAAEAALAGKGLTSLTQEEIAEI